MYSWDDKTDDWLGPAKYKFSDSRKAERDVESAKAAAKGPRTYSEKRQPNFQIIDPKKRIVSGSKNPLIVAVDVTGSMANWPREIFDRLPLLYNTLSQYRPDLDISFAAIGDAGCDRWPLQVTDFGKGYTLEEHLKAIFGEGGGGDEPESYGLFAHWMNTHVTATSADRPFLIVFGDATMHPKVPRAQIEHFLGDDVKRDPDSLAAWGEVAQRWNTWFLRRPTGRPGDPVEEQWAQAIGRQQVVLMDDEQRAVDYAMGLVARAWGHFGDFKTNMAARQDEKKIVELEKRIDSVLPRALSCPKCSAPLPLVERGARLSCSHCGATVEV